MPPTLHHECTRIPVTAIVSCGALLVAAEGPYLRFYHAKDSRYIASKRVFKAQAVHGISVYSEEHDDLIKLVVWGGSLIRALEISLASGVAGSELAFGESEVLKTSDWILDLAPRLSSLEDEGEYQEGTCVAVTAHNALLEITISRPKANAGRPFELVLSSLELTSSSRSILYSAHVFWESQDCVLVAAGTAFGEIMYWSWRRQPGTDATSGIHRVFLGHEGSVFGVCISKELPSGCCQNLKRIIASCSDDRTIRIWDVSDVSTQDSHIAPPSQDVERQTHTGFSNAAFDLPSSSSSDCLAIGWGHMSRIWTVQFSEATPCEGALALLSTGEDATSRSWRLSPTDESDATMPYKLTQRDCAAHHSGKNIWSSAVHIDEIGRQRVFCGAADSKITSYPLARNSQRSQSSIVSDYTVQDIMSLAQTSDHFSGDEIPHHPHKSSKQAEFFRSYCFPDQQSLLVTTNSGKVFITSLQTESSSENLRTLAASTLIAQSEDLSGYSVCTSETKYGVAFVAGSTGTIYTYSRSLQLWSQLGSMDTKIGDMFATEVFPSCGRNMVALLATFVGKNQARLLFVDIPADTGPCVIRSVPVPAPKFMAGSIVTSMSLATSDGAHSLFLGFRRGAVAVYRIPREEADSSESTTVLRVVDGVHGDETVTALTWAPSTTHGSMGHLTSVGRNGCIAVHHIDLVENCLELVHHLTLPIGPNIEGCYMHQGHLLVHGFSSKRWILYDVTTEEEVTGVETGGAHRSWAFLPGTSTQNGGTLVWTRASSMHISSQAQATHSVVRSGGHGRELKAVAVTDQPAHRLIATGAEDTDIKLFEYTDGEMVCRRTLRKHTTGIQHLQWSADGKYLFSSGGCEEFYIWKVRQLASVISIGVVCEFSYTPESEHADLRIMSFDVTKQGAAYDIAMVFSDSSLKVYQFNPAAAIKWQPLASGLYFTSCLTQCFFLSTESILTAGTDGHTAVWPLNLDNNELSVGSSNPASVLKWEQPLRIHQSSSKVMASHAIDASAQLMVSGGDDGSIAVLLMRRTTGALDTENVYAAWPVLLQRTHASAVTACAIVQHEGRIFILTTGNDQWLRLWEVTIHKADSMTPQTASAHGNDTLDISRLGKIKTNVADASSMAVVETKEADARVLICGVGMEVVRVEWDCAA